jgi:MerR HTH family regulatory protein/GAF domain
MNGPCGRLPAGDSDAVAIVRLEDGILVDGNEALSRITGHPPTGLLGRPAKELVVWLWHASPSSVLAEPLGKGEAVSNLPVAVRTRAGKLTVTRVSALPVVIDGRAHALCTVRGGREPTRPERRMAAHAELERIAGQHGPWPAAATPALAALCECLDWEAGAVWQVDPEVEALRCVGFWNTPTRSFEALEAASRRRTFLPGEGLLGRTWLSGRPASVADVTADQGFTRRQAAIRTAVRGWAAWPVLADDRVVGVVELFSRAARPPDDDLQELGTGLGHHLGRLLGRAAADGPGEGAGRPAEAGDPPTLLRELAASVGRLNRLLEKVIENDRLDRDPSFARPGRAGHDAGLPADLLAKRPVGLTLKAVSQRTGIPGATVRTWERRYGFIRPVRSASGYRLYREDDISRILTVKRLLSEGVRISDAVTVVGAPVRPVRELPAEETG